MTVSNLNTSVVHRGDGVTTSFPYTFRIPDPSYAVVQLQNYATGVITATLTSGQYSITGATPYNTGGNVVYNPGTPLSADYNIIIRRVLPLTQTLDLNNQGGFFPETLEFQLDRIEMQIQQLNEQIARSPKLGVNTAVPTDVIPAANKVLGFDSGGVFGAYSNVDFAEEYGTWTPELRFGGASTGITYTRQQGIYLAQGRRVSGVFEMLLSSKGSATGVSSIAGLPYPGISWGTGPQYQSAGVIAAYDGMASLGYPPAMINVLSELYLYIYSATTTGNMQDTNFTNTSRLRGYFSYIKAA